MFSPGVATQHGGPGGHLTRGRHPLPQRRLGHRFRLAPQQGFIQRQPGANVIDVADRVKALLPQLQSALPAAVQVTVLADRIDPRIGGKKS